VEYEIILAEYLSTGIIRNVKKEMENEKD